MQTVFMGLASLVRLVGGTVWPLNSVPSAEAFLVRTKIVPLTSSHTHKKAPSRGSPVSVPPVPGSSGPLLASSGVHADIRARRRTLPFNVGIVKLLQPLRSAKPIQNLAAIFRP